MLICALGIHAGCGASTEGGADPDDATSDDDDDDLNLGDGTTEPDDVDAFVALPAPGTVLWTSEAWSNGKSRTLTSAHDYDPFDDQLELAAGTGRKWTTSGDGTSRLEGNRSRVYLHASHKNIEMVFEANATDKRLENISTKLRSRHNEGGSTSNRFGGYGVAFSLDAPEVEFKIEDYHNEHESGRTHELAKRLEYNHWYRYKVVIQAKEGDAKAVVSAFIDYNLDGNFTPVGSETYKRTGYRKNDKNAKYTWIRANSGDEVQKGLLLRNASITEVAPL